MTTNATDRRGDWEEAPKSLRWMFLITERLGFPIMAFFLMFWLCVVSLAKINDTLLQVNEALKLNGSVLNDLKNKN